MFTACCASLKPQCPSFISFCALMYVFCLKCLESNFIIEAIILIQRTQKLMWNLGFGGKDSLECFLEKQDPLESFPLCLVLQVRLLSYPSLSEYQVLFVFSSLGFSWYLWKSLCSASGSATIKLHHPLLKPVYTSFHLLEFIIFFLLLLKFRVTKDLGLPYFWNGSSFFGIFHFSQESNSRIKQKYTF